MRKRPLLQILLLSLTGLLSCSGSDNGPVDSDPTPAISVSDQTVTEGNTALFSISLDQAVNHAVTFSFATADISAQAASDYAPVSGVDTIVAGQTVVTVLVPTFDDDLVEGNETFAFVLSSVSGATVSHSVATGTITDNDSDQVSFATQVQPLLRTSCAKLQICHGGALPGGGLFIGATAEYTDVLSATGTVTGGPVVLEGNSSASTLYTKTTDDWIFGSRMPQAAAALQLQQQNLIRDWIDQGAQNN